MRLLFGVCALAAVASATAPRCTAQAGAARGNQDRSTDTLRLSRLQAIAAALTGNGQIEAARQQVGEAAARRVTGNAIPDPQFTAGFDQETSPFAFNGAPSRPVTLGLSIPFPDKFRLNNKIGLADVGNSQANLRLQQQTIALQASATYDSLLVALLHRQNLIDAQKLAQDFLTRTMARFEAGTVAKLDVIQARVTVAQAQNDLISNERDLLNAQASLNRTLGRVVGAPIVPTDTLALPPTLPDSATIETIALQNRQELKALQQLQLGQSATTKLAKEFWIPDVTFGVAKDYSAPGQALFTTGISMPLPLFYWQHARGDIALSQHTESELAATYRDTRAQVTQDVRAAYANASTTMRQVTFLRDELVPSAREAYRVSSTSYSLGGSSALEVITARTALLQAEAQLADALAAANTARADLDRALGLSTTAYGATIR
ncbi:MAG TPA: TolC family protein [Gemmatimonadaceae bacterium]|jgi:cobalt-zinc-cadmium efflux system outer membrane protein|nr:TolC family protein [Gemmatimonadaceae bacterium]